MDQLLPEVKKKEDIKIEQEDFTMDQEDTSELEEDIKLEDEDISKEEEVLSFTFPDDPLALHTQKTSMNEVGSEARVKSSGKVSNPAASLKCSEDSQTRFVSDMKRAIPISHIDLELLTDLVAQEKILQNRSTDGRIVQLKRQAWARVAAKVNAAGYGEPRAAQQVQKIWERFRAKAKREHAFQRRELRKTGKGGPPSMPNGPSRPSNSLQQLDFGDACRSRLLPKRGAFQQLDALISSRRASTEEGCVTAWRSRMSEESLSSWSRPHTLLFIDLLRQHPCLWKVKSKDYKNKNLRNVAVNTVCIEMTNKSNCIVTPDVVMRKIHTLRTQFRREVKAVQDSKKSGAGTEDVYTPRLWCFDELCFFDDGDILRESTSALDEVEPCCQDRTSGNVVEGELSSPVSHRSTPSPCAAPPTTCVPPTLSPSPSCSSTGVPTPDRRPAKKRKQMDNVDDVLRVALTKLSAQSDPDADFGKVVSNELRQMTDDQKKIAKKIIYDVIYLGSTASLTKDHQVVETHGSHVFIA